MFYNSINTCLRITKELRRRLSTFSYGTEKEGKNNNAVWRHKLTAQQQLNNKNTSVLHTIQSLCNSLSIFFIHKPTLTHIKLNTIRAKIYISFIVRQKFTVYTILRNWHFSTKNLNECTKFVMKADKRYKNVQHCFGSLERKTLNQSKI